MYEAYFGLREKPFSILPDPDMLYWSRSHRFGLAVLEYGFLNNASFTVVTGDIGSGKTTLVRYLLRRIEPWVTVGVISNTPATREELLAWALMALDQPFEGSYSAMLKRFRDFLHQHYAADRRTMLIIDEAQNLSVEALEELRMLSNVNADKHQLLQLILVGQLELQAKLRRPELRQFAQRVSADFHLKPLEQDEVPKYIAHRLQAAGCKRQLFFGEACLLIGRASAGIPRVINILCDTALVYAYSLRQEQVSEELIREVIADKRNYGVFPLDDYTRENTG